VKSVLYSFLLNRWFHMNINMKPNWITYFMELCIQVKTFMYTYICTIIPIPKSHNTNTSDSANFRGIALRSVFGKVFDNIILERYHQKLSSCDMQFDFKPKSPTNMCSMVLKNVVSYYVQHHKALRCFLHISRCN